MLSNPYWFIWWLTVGGVALFLLGHILADFAWYGFVGYGMEMGGKVLKTSVLRFVLFLCTVFLLLFGAFLLYRGIIILF